MSDIFISYATEDRVRASVMASALEDRGWTVWWDRKILPGRVFDKVITEALGSAKCVIVLWSTFSVDSDWVKEEAADGARRKILVPALIDDVSIPFGFGRIQAAQLRAWQTDADDPEFLELLESVSQILGASAERSSIPKVKQSPPESNTDVRPTNLPTSARPMKDTLWLWMTRPINIKDTLWLYVRLGASIGTFVIVLFVSGAIATLWLPDDLPASILLVPLGFSLLLSIVVWRRLR